MTLLICPRITYATIFSSIPLISAINVAMDSIIGCSFVIITCSRGLGLIGEHSNPFFLTYCSDTIAKHWHPESHKAQVDKIELIKILMYIPFVSRSLTERQLFNFNNLPARFRLSLLPEATRFPTPSQSQKSLPLL